MTVPNGEAGINLPDFGVTDNGSIPGLPSRTQANAENFYKGRVQDSPSWSASSPIFGAVVNSLVAGIFHLIADRVGTIPLVGGALEQVIDGFADWLFQTEGTANMAPVAQATANNAQSAIDQLTAVVNSDVDPGETVIFSFPGADDAALDGNWTDLVSGLAIRSNTAGIASGAGSTVRPAVICNTAFTGDGNEVSVVLGSSGQSSQSTWILFGMDSSGTVAVAGEVRTNGCALRRITRSGSTWATAETWTTSGTGFSNGDRVAVRRNTGESTYRIYRNGGVVLAYNDSGNTHPRTSGYWRAGFREERTLDIFGVIAYDSFRINSFRLFDMGTAPAVGGTAWRVSRLNTANSTGTTWTTSGVAFHSSCFDSTDYAVGGATVASGDVGIGRALVPTTGWYLLSAGVDLSTGFPNRGVGVHAGPSGSMTLQPGRLCWGINPGSEGEASRGLVGSKMYYLQANWYVMPVGMTETGTASMLLRGDAAGTRTWFEGTLVKSAA